MGELRVKVTLIERKGDLETAIKDMCWITGSCMQNPRLQEAVLGKSSQDTMFGNLSPCPKTTFGYFNKEECECD